MNKKSVKIKKVLYIAVIGLLTTFSLHAQRNSVRIGYIDTEYILENVEEYNQAKTLLAEKTKKWKTDIEKKLNAINQKKQQLDNERVLLTKELIEEKQEEIDIEQNEVLDYQQKRFGAGGDLIIQRKQLIQPIQDQIFNAVQEVASTGKYDFIFDKSADVVMLYSAERYNISDRVLSLITRAGKRKQATSKKERKALEEQQKEELEETTAAIPSQSKEDKDLAREEKRLARAEERKRLNQEWKDEQAALKAEREAKKKAIAAEREKTRQEKLAARNAERNTKTAQPAATGDDNVSTDAKAQPAKKEIALTPQQARKKALEEKKRKILEAREKKAQEASKKKKTTEKKASEQELTPIQKRRLAIEEKKKKILEERRKAAQKKDSTNN